MNVTMGQRIHDLLIDRNMSITTLQKITGIPRTKLSMIKNDYTDTNNGKQRTFTTDELLLCADALGVSPAFLLTGYNDDNAIVSKDLNLSNDALNVLKQQKDTSVPVILSQIIEHRLFVQLVRNIEILCKPQREYNKMFTSAVLLHLTSDLPYFDNPEDIQTVYRYSTIKLFENIIDSIVERKGEQNETGKR